MAIQLKEYLDETGHSPFTSWFRCLNSQAATKVVTVLYRLKQGNFSNVEGVGAGVFEYKLNFGPGYRIYFGKDGEQLVILVGGGTKQQQSKDIKLAKQRWQDYKNRKRHSGLSL